jgi:hypothetical protein
MKSMTLLLALTVAGTVQAGTANALKSCYDYAGVNRPAKPVETELFVLVDQTTLFDGTLKQMIADNIKPFIKPGNALSVTQFSAFTQGHYTQVLTAYQLDPLLDAAARNDVSKPALAKFDQCLGVQAQQASQLAGMALKASFGGASSEISKSDVVASLKDISSRVRTSTARRKVVLVASDMLENSSLSSFYAKQAVRRIDPAIELKRVEQNQLFGNFNRASIYVLGAGLLAEDGRQRKGVYRDPQTMQALQSFWRSYFQQSNGQLVEFGQPALLNPVQ